MNRNVGLHARVILPILIVFVCLVVPQTVSAHAILLEANPAQGSSLKESPDKIVLTFNERLGGKLYKLKVKDENRKSVTENKAKLSKKHRKVMLKVPELDDGVYTVTYKVISADGHPVDSTYTFTIGDVSDSTSATSAANNIRQGGHDHSIAGYAVRIAYLLSLLFVTGWTIWGMTFRKKSQEIREGHNRVSKTLKILYLFMLLGFGFVELSNVLSDLGDNKVVSLFTSSAIGVSWLTSLILAVAGFWVLGRSKWIDAIWVAVLLGAQAFNGHAFAFHPRAITFSFDFLHLVGAAIWSGGLLYLIYFWKKQPEHIQRFLPVFSKTALVSIIVIVITGTVDAVLFLPEIRDVFLTWWGRLLLIKVALVILVIITAALIRSAMKKKHVESIRPKLKVDFTTMALLIAVAAVFTTLNPRPVNEPFTWRKTENQMTVTTNVTPRLPQAANTFTIRVRAENEPNEVKLAIRNKSDDEDSSQKIPLALTGHKDQTYVYQTQGQIPMPGKWEVTIRILDDEDNFTKLQKDMRVYPTDI